MQGVATREAVVTSQWTEQETKMVAAYIGELLPSSPEPAA